MASGIHISLTAEKLFTIGDFLPVTNSLLSSWIVMLFLVIFSLLITRKAALIPGKLQSIGEIVIEGLHNLFASVLGDKTVLFFPLLATYFIYIISLNWAGLFPGYGTIGLNIVEEGHKAFVPILRAGTADLNTTMAFAILSVLIIQISGLKMLGLSYLKKFFILNNPIMFFVGILELLGEFTKIVSFSFRLFGNVFAGEVLLTVIAFLMPVIAPIPFLGMELFVGFIQAVVFSMLTCVFLSGAMAKSEH